MGVTVSLPFTLTNGTTADASQVMADFNAIVTAFANNTAESGSNSSITALTGLVTPLTPAVGGTPVYFGGTSAGTANAQTVSSTTPTNFTLGGKTTIIFVAGLTNTGAMTLTVGSTAATNVFKRSFSGPVALTGGEVVAGNLVKATYDGTQYEIINDLPGAGKLTNLTSATTTYDLGTIASHNVNLTVTNATIASFGSTATIDFPVFVLKFAGTFTLTNSGSLALPGGQNITTAANDTAVAQYLGGGNWQVIAYQHAAAVPSTGAAPVVQQLTSGSGATWTPTTPVAQLKYIRVRMCGGGGGGGAQGTNPGTNGNNTTFQINSTGTAWIAGGGTGGGAASVAVGGAGGTTVNTGSQGTLVLRMAGQAGSGSGSASQFGSYGGSTPFFGGGGVARGTTGTGQNATANSGGGGAGGGSLGAAFGGGGGSGEYVEILASGITTATYTVGAAANGGVAGTQAGGNGAAGIIIVEEYPW